MATRGSGGLKGWRLALPRGLDDLAGSGRVRMRTPSRVRPTASIGLSLHGPTRRRRPTRRCRGLGPPVETSRRAPRSPGPRCRSPPMPSEKTSILRCSRAHAASSCMWAGGGRTGRTSTPRRQGRRLRGAARPRRSRYRAPPPLCRRRHAAARERRPCPPAGLRV